MGISRYPRSGHRIAPLALREILDVPRYRITCWAAVALPTCVGSVNLMRPPGHTLALRCVANWARQSSARCRGQLKLRAALAEDSQAA